MDVRGEGVYIISIAAELVAAHPRTLRIYETEGLVRPARRNNLRLYSERDLERIRLIRLLTGRLGLNLAGARLVLALYDAGRFTLDELLAGEFSGGRAKPTAGE